MSDYIIRAKMAGRMVYVTADGKLTGDISRAAGFCSRESAATFMLRLPWFNRTCYGIDAELCRTTEVVSLSEFGYARNGV